MWCIANIFYYFNFQLSSVEMRKEVRLLECKCRQLSDGGLQYVVAVLLQLSEDNDHQSSSRRLHSRQSCKVADDGKLRLTHYKGSLVVVKLFHSDVAPTITQIDKVEMTAVRYCSLR